jgi:hypothetical protein
LSAVSSPNANGKYTFRGNLGSLKIVVVVVVVRPIRCLTTCKFGVGCVSAMRVTRATSRAATRATVYDLPEEVVE